MDKALVFGTKDCRFESCQGHYILGSSGLGLMCYQWVAGRAVMALAVMTHSSPSWVFLFIGTLWGASAFVCMYFLRLTVLLVSIAEWRSG